MAKDSQFQGSSIGFTAEVKQATQASLRDKLLGKGDEIGPKIGFSANITQAKPREGGIADALLGLRESFNSRVGNLLPQSRTLRSVLLCSALAAFGVAKNPTMTGELAANATKSTENAITFVANTARNAVEKCDTKDNKLCQTGKAFFSTLDRK